MFGLLSLLSEVGGFSALLIGASVVTVIEFIDFLIFYCCGLCFGDKRPDYEEAQTTDPPITRQKPHVYAVPDGDDIYTSLPRSNRPFHIPHQRTVASGSSMHHNRPPQMLPASNLPQFHPQHRMTVESQPQYPQQQYTQQQYLDSQPHMSR